MELDKLLFTCPYCRETVVVVRDGRAFVVRKRSETPELHRREGEKE